MSVAEIIDNLNEIPATPEQNYSVYPPVNQTGSPPIPPKRPLKDIVFWSISGLLFVLCIAVGIWASQEHKSESNSQSNEYQITTPFPTSAMNLSSTIASATIKNTPTGVAIKTPTITSEKTTATPALISNTNNNPTGTSSPTRTPNPPIINISYPAEMQSIEMIQGKHLCIVDVPAGGDTSDMQWRYNINNSGWDGYFHVYTMCITPNEGQNRLQFQYKNSHGEESQIYTRQFDFHWISPMTITYSGQLFLDSNCNGTLDPNSENNLPLATKINIQQIPGGQTISSFSSNSDGSWSYSQQIMDNETVTLQATVDTSISAPYVLHPNPDKIIFNRTFDKNARSVSIMQPIVTTDIYASVCQH